MGRASVLNRVASVSLKEKMTFGKDSKQLREFTCWISRGRLSRQKFETAMPGTLRQQHAWHIQTTARKPQVHIQTTARKPHVGQHAREGKSIRLAKKLIWILL